jgi:beta-lactamase superfamily II metal-dependent hydrolase
MYNGIEIDMLSVGDGDCILLTRWNGLQYETVLIDGGNGGGFQKLKSFLLKRGIRHLHSVVNTHPHEDHVAGIIELLKDKEISVGRLYFHWPYAHFQADAIDNALIRAKGTEEAQVIRKALNASLELTSLAINNQVAWNVQPFAGTKIGSLTVVGPTESFYKTAAAEIVEPGLISQFDSINKEYLRLTSSGDFLAKEMLGTSVLLEDPITAPLNNTSVMLAFRWDAHVYLFTGDAGAPAINVALAGYKELERCYWMQIPHHGSRRNLTTAQIANLSPNIAFVSAAGSIKHPRRSVVNAFKKIGTRVFSTHHPTSTHLRMTEGSVPVRPEYNCAVPLWDQTGQEQPTVATKLFRPGLLGLSRTPLESLHGGLGRNRLTGQK